MSLMVKALARRELGRHFDLLSQMHRLRARVFQDRLDWDVTVCGDMEIDLYDADDATYILLIFENEVVGHARLLPTTGPNMLADTFPMLLGNVAPPCSPVIVESSRFCIDTSRVTTRARRAMRQATFFLLAGILEWALDRQQRAIATVTDTRMERILRQAGWSLERLGAPLLIGATEAVAGLLPVSRQTLLTIRGAGGIAGPVLGDQRSLTLAA